MDGDVVNDVGKIWEGSDLDPIVDHPNPDQTVDQGPDQTVDQGPDQTVDQGPDQTVDQGPDQTVDQGGPPPCNVTYGKVPGYKLCSESATLCVFYFKVKGKESCDNICGKVGKTCITSAYDINDSCPTSGKESCSFKHKDAVCTCTR